MSNNLKNTKKMFGEVKLLDNGSGQGEAEIPTEIVEASRPDYPRSHAEPACRKRKSN
jgi:hypothetical protein